ncbi:MAG: WG repeat-containing protein [Longimicrobiales bacterium]
MHNLRILAVSAICLVFVIAESWAQLVPFRDSDLQRWGFKQSNGQMAIAPRFVAAGTFRNGRAPVEDSLGFAIIDHSGAVVDRVTIDSLTAARAPMPPPDRCAWSDDVPFPSTTLQCYILTLRGGDPMVGGEVVRVPARGEANSSAAFFRMQSGVIVIENRAYGGFTRRVLLPGVSEAQALDWRRQLYPDRPAGPGCSERWTAGAVRGGAFIQQQAGC